MLTTQNLILSLATRFVAIRQKMDGHVTLSNFPKAKNPYLKKKYIVCYKNIYIIVYVYYVDYFGEKLETPT